jgi:hypothetical protein
MAVSRRLFATAVATGLAGAALAAMAACQPVNPPVNHGGLPGATPSAGSSASADTGLGSRQGNSSPKPNPSTSTWASPSSSASAQSGPRIVYFKVTQKPKCPEGTAVFRAPAVPVVITWKVTGATGIALSVDNPELVGAYGSYGREGTETFMFSCNGSVGSVETHVYTIYTTGGGPQRRADLKASAKVMDNGPGSG